MTAIATVLTTDTIDIQRLRLNDTIGRWNALGEADAIVITGGTINTVSIKNQIKYDADFRLRT